jgi:hypothetical protein
VLHFFKPSSGSRASSPVLMDTGVDDPDDPPAVQEEVHPERTRGPCFHVSLRQYGSLSDEDATGMLAPSRLAMQVTKPTNTKTPTMAYLYRNFLHNLQLIPVTSEALRTFIQHLQVYSHRDQIPNENLVIIITCKIWGSYGSGYHDPGLLECDVTHFGR